MNTEEIQKHFNGEAYHKDKWIDASQISEFENFIIYGDPRGDTFIKTTETAEQLEKLAQNYVNGHTDCDFETRIYLICRNGKEVKAKIVLEDV